MRLVDVNIWVFIKEDYDKKEKLGIDCELTYERVRGVFDADNVDYFYGDTLNERPAVVVCLKGGNEFVAAVDLDKFKALI